MVNELTKRLTIRVRILMEHPFLWCWEIADTADGRLLESSWASKWEAYGSSEEALSVGVKRLAEHIQARPERMGLARIPAPRALVPTTRRLIIVSRQGVGRYKQLREVFAESEQFEVILDRRCGERRRRNDPAMLDRRRGERRSHSEVDAQVRSRGWAMLFLADVQARSPVADHTKTA